ncbi:MAG: DUF2298 domain-containing protein [Acidobacteria bacterium]|jgi:YYY domain-containing protein|nr:DUF2298 domain-containing protein [Acidobacteriota bacterium]
MTGVLFYLAVLVAGLGGYAGLARLGIRDRNAWAYGRVAGLVAIALPAWWSGAVGFSGWRWLGGGLLILGGALGAITLYRRRGAWREILVAEAVFLVGFAGVLLLRLDHPEIRGTEKPMDLGILATLLRARSFPPPDMWLAGASLPYYYWGALLWTVPLALSHVPLEIGYNLIVALLGGLVAAAAWSLASQLANSRGAPWLAAFFAVFAGTPDGLRQILAGRSMLGLDFWASSRQVPNTITEFPLFTFWLGDLHPHLISLPLSLLTVLLALHAGRKGPRVGVMVAVAASFGVTWAANPWAMPPTLAAVALMLVAGDGRWRWPIGHDLVRWVLVLPVAIGGWLFTIPFQLAFHPPFHGIGLVHAWTSVPDLLLYGGSLIVGAWIIAVRVAADLGGSRIERRQALGAAAIALGVVLAAATGKAVLALLAVGMMILVVGGMRGDVREDRPALLLAALGVFMFLIPEIIYVRDPYGAQLHRMNTVFKSYFQGWILLAIALPALLWQLKMVRWKKVVLVTALVIPTLPHLAGMASAPILHRPLGLDGLRWMTPGDRDIVRFLRRQPAGAVVAEAVGHAYSDYARLSAASGVPAVLGWANHELVWRGPVIGPELERRRQLVQKIFGSGNSETVAAAARKAGATLVAVGSMEHRTYTEAGLKAVEKAGRIVLRKGSTVVVAMDPQAPAGPVVQEQERAQHDR